MISTAKKLALSAIILPGVIAFGAFASTPEPPDAPRDYVIDLAGIFKDSSWYQLNHSLKDLEQRTTAQVLVLTVQSLDGQSIEEFAFNTKEKWRLGQKGRDNGILIVVAVKDRAYRFEVGYGLEDVLPDSLVGTIGRRYLAPHFKKGDYRNGISQAINALSKRIPAREGAQTINIQHDDRGQERHINISGTLVMIFLLFPLVLIFVRSRSKETNRNCGNSG